MVRVIQYIYIYMYLTTVFKRGTKNLHVTRLNIVHSTTDVDEWVFFLILSDVIKLFMWFVWYFSNTIIMVTSIVQKQVYVCNNIGTVILEYE